jgi:hypothetical protein
MAENDEITVRDVVDVLKGHATEEQARRVAVALNDPSSEVSGWIAELARLSTSLPGPDRRQQKSVLEWSFGPRAQVDAILQFVQDKHSTGEITAAELIQIEKVCEPGRELSPDSARLAASNLTDVIVSLHPEFEAELRSLAPSRSR